jgi:Ca2+-binding RTX toxin-like protein
LGLGLAMELLSPDDDPSEGDEMPLDITLDEGTADFEGTDAKEHVQGNALDNFIFGGDGNDLLGGHDGADTLQGGNGDDRLFTSAGDDVGLGGEGNDKIFLGDGDDTTLDPNGTPQDAGDDFIRGGDGDDTLFDSQGTNQIHGDLGHDTIITVDGLAPDGTLDETPETTPDTIHAGFGDDTLVGDDGDIMTGGEGADSFVVVKASDSPDAPAVITDFDFREDLFSLVYLEDAPVDPTVRFEFDFETNLLRAMVDGQEVATLFGLTPADIPFIQTFVTTLPELLET